MKAICPRCESHEVAQVHVGIEGGNALWRVWHCGACAFTWRDSEFVESADSQASLAWPKLKDVDLSRLR